ncbi:MAG: DnaB-like helicase C-terminal domain-containing protein [Candidatus Pacebacteria bacterium]|jgi:replicative DNA helicase|nr:DnaB-like helicase C-terminal domain-containing protein [Candidatus Paceibacterota bacterium]
MRIEQLILENLIYDSQYASLVGVFLKPEYFRAHPEKIVFREIQNHIKEYNKSPSVSSLANIISERDDLNENLFKNCLEILKAYKKKSDDTEWLIHETEKWAKDAAVYNGIVDSIAILEGKDTKKPKDAIPDMLTDALAVSLDTSVGHNYIDDASERWDYYHKREQRYPFGIEMLDKITGGGISPKTLTVFLGGTGSGKTLVKTHLASQYIKQGFDVLYITMEMAQERIAERVDANLLDIDLDQIRLLPRDSFNAKIEKMMNSTRNFGRLVIKEYPTSGAHVGNFRGLLRELKIKKRFTPQIVILDYLNICASNRVKWTSNMNTYVYIKSIAEEIRGFAVECNVPVITSSQLNREGYMSSDPDMSNISESFGLPATADLMLAIVAKEDNGGQLMFKQLKNRYSDPTINSKFMLGMNKNRMRLESISQSQQPVLANGGGDTKKTPDSPFLKQHKDVKTATSDWKI